MNSSFRKVLGIVTAVLAAAAAAALIISAVSIFRAGTLIIAENGALANEIYSPETISARFRVIAPILYAFLAAAAAGIISRAFYVEKRKFVKPHRIEKKAPANAKAVKIIRIAVLVLAVALIVFGVANGGMHDVLVKAKKICMECVGLG